MLVRPTIMTTTMATSLMISSAFYILLGGGFSSNTGDIGNHILVAAEEDLQQQQQQQEQTLMPTSFEMPEYYCDTGPDALTEFFGKSIPRTCIDVPYNSDDDVSSTTTTTTLERCYYTFVPDSCTAAAAAAASSSTSTSPLNLPLVFDIHGLGSCPLYSAAYTGWLEKAQEECFVVVWPTGNIDDKQVVKGCWNLPGFLRDDDYGVDGTDFNDVTAAPCCCFESADATAIVSPSEEPNDPLFLRMVIDSVVESFENNETNENNDEEPENENENENDQGTTMMISIDRSRVYMAGHSNGCMASLTMAAMHSDVVAAVCCHAGTLLTPFPSNYSPVPIWMAHGMKDTTVAFNGSTLVDFAPFGSIGFWSTEDVVNYIANKNECEDEDEDELVLLAEDNTTTTATTVGTTFKRTNCTNNADVELVALLESGHLPYYMSPDDNKYVSLLGPGAQGIIADETTVVDTTALAWEFCSSYSNSYQIQLQEEEKEKGVEATTQEVPTTSIVMNNNNDTIATTGDDEKATTGSTSSQAPVDDEKEEEEEEVIGSPVADSASSGKMQAMISFGVIFIISSTINLVIIGC